MIAARAAGNPFFVEEIVRDLAERGVLHGQPGAYRCAAMSPRSGAGHPAGHHRRAHRPPWPAGQTHPECRGGDRRRDSTPTC